MTLQAAASPLHLPACRALHISCPDTPACSSCTPSRRPPHMTHASNATYDCTPLIQSSSSLQTADKLTVEVFPVPADGDIVHAAIRRAVVPGGPGQEDDKLQLPSERLIKQSTEALDGLVSCGCCTWCCCTCARTVQWRAAAVTCLLHHKCDVPSCGIHHSARLVRRTHWCVGMGSWQYHTPGLAINHIHGLTPPPTAALPCRITPT